MTIIQMKMYITEQYRLPLPPLHLSLFPPILLTPPPSLPSFLFILAYKLFFLSILFLSAPPCSDQQSSKVKMYMMDIMSSVFQEGETLSQEILDAILTNFIEPTKVGRIIQVNYLMM